MREQSIKDLFVFTLLVAIGVVGRWGQPDWCITPLAATGLFAGYYFRRVGIAVLVPLISMLITDLALSAYQHFGVMIAVYFTITSSALLGRVLRHGAGFGWLAKLGFCTLAPATLFFLISNFAVWAWSVSPFYEKSLAGLAMCYTAALPFYRNMLVGDVAFTALLFGAAAAVGALSANARQSETA